MTRLSLVHVDTMSCEPILRRMPNGELLVVCQCGDVREPAPLNRVYAFISADEGKTWGEPICVWPEDGRAVYQTETNVLDGVIRVYLTVHDGHFIDWECHVVASRDNGRTWVKEGRTPVFPAFTFIRGLTKLKNGNFLMPYQHYPVSAQDNARLKENNAYVWDSEIKNAHLGVLISRDEGKTFVASKPLEIPCEKGKWVWPEGTVAELSNGRLVMLFRFDGEGFLYRTESEDGGQTWSAYEKTDIPSPNNKCKLYNLPDGRIALLHTPNNSSFRLRGRTPLSLWISNDDMQSWSVKEDVVTIPGYLSYPDGYVTEDGKKLLFAFDYNRHDIMFAEVDIPE